MAHRSTPYWQDVRIKNASNPLSDERPLAPEHMRSNVQGLSVEYSKRYLDAQGESRGVCHNSLLAAAVAALQQGQCPTITVASYNIPAAAHICKLISRIHSITIPNITHNPAARAAPASWC
jgi:hypothetical protein